MLECFVQLRRLAGSSCPVEEWTEERGGDAKLGGCEASGARRLALRGVWRQAERLWLTEEPKWAGTISKLSRVLLADRTRTQENLAFNR